MSADARIGDNQLIAWADELSDLDQQIADLQTAKRDFYAAIRDGNGKVIANALKAAMRIRAMDSEKRALADEVDTETARILSVLERPRAPRATRAREIIEEFPPHDLETGELADHQSGDGYARNGAETAVSDNAPTGSASDEIPATSSPGPHLSAVPGDEPSIPSSAASGAKTDGVATVIRAGADAMSGNRNAQAEQVATNSDPRPTSPAAATSDAGAPVAAASPSSSEPAVSRHYEMPDVPAFLRRSA